jgi:hypothetical protein
VGKGRAVVLSLVVEQDADLCEVHDPVDVIVEATFFGELT